MPKSWRKSDLIPIYRGKGEVRLRGSYGSVKFLEHGIKVIERIFEKGLRNVIRVDEIQMGFIPERRTIDAIYILRQMLETYETAGGNCMWCLSN